MSRYVAVALLALVVVGCDSSDPTGVTFKEPVSAAYLTCGRIIVEREGVRRGGVTLDTIPCRYHSEGGN